MKTTSWLIYQCARVASQRMIVNTKIHRQLGACPDKADPLRAPWRDTALTAELLFLQKWADQCTAGDWPDSLHSCSVLTACTFCYPDWVLIPFPSFILVLTTGLWVLSPEEWKIPQMPTSFSFILCKYLAGHLTLFCCYKFNVLFFLLLYSSISSVNRNTFFLREKTFLQTSCLKVY